MVQAYFQLLPIYKYILLNTLIILSSTTQRNCFISNKFMLEMGIKSKENWQVSFGVEFAYLVIHELVQTSRGLQPM